MVAFMDSKLPLKWHERNHRCERLRGRRRHVDPELQHVAVDGELSALDDEGGSVP
jgi:hypothetical protein